jgi:pimeloyl-ACP methyl ester carboxylesterase
LHRLGEVDLRVAPFVHRYNSKHSYLTEAKRAMCLADAAEVVRQEHDGMARDTLFENRAWPFEPAPLEMPCLMWHGANDETVLPAAASYLAKKLGVSLVSTEGGHFGP